MLKNMRIFLTVSGLLLSSLQLAHSQVIATVNSREITAEAIQLNFFLQQLSASPEPVSQIEVINHRGE